MRRLHLTHCIVLLLVLPLVMSRSLTAQTPETWVADHLEPLIELYREFHQDPELSFHEAETAKRFAAWLEKAEYEVVTGVGGHGVVGLLRNGQGPTLMLRSDLDGLPVTEQTGLVYSSQKKVTQADGTQVGVMHACGHDVHMTNVLGVAQYLADNRHCWQGTLMVIGQPAEERGAGAKAMLEDGLFEKYPRPDFALALHVDSTLAAGHIAYRAGYSLANVDSVDITVHGRGGHGAFPHTTVDPIVQAAQLVMSLQTIVSREVKPIEPAVITVGSIHGGTKHNIIGDDCHLQLTVRSYSDEVRTQLLEAIRRKAKGVAIAAGAQEPDIKVSEGTPSLENHRELVKRLDPVFREALGREFIHDAEPSMGGEDFSRYGREGVPILMYRLGAVDGRRLARYAELGQQPPSLHSPLFYPDAEKTIETGIVTMSYAAMELLKAPESR